MPVGADQHLGEVFNDPQAAIWDSSQEVHHPKAGRVRAPGIPVRLSETPAGRLAPPLLGEHTDEVMRELGYAPDEIEKLHTDGAV